MADEQSAFAKAIEARHRKIHEYDVSGLFGLGDIPIPKIGIRVCTKLEEETALRAAHEHVVKLANGLDSAKTDEDIIMDSKAVEILYRACVNLEDPRGSAFPGPKWMRERLTTDQIAGMLHMVNEVKMKEGKQPLRYEDAEVEAVIELCTKHAGSEAPEQFLGAMPRVMLSHCLILICTKLADARAALGVVDDPGNTSAEDAIAPIVLD